MEIFEGAPKKDSTETIYTRKMLLENEIIAKMQIKGKPSDLETIVEGVIDSLSDASDYVLTLVIEKNGKIS